MLNKINNITIFQKQIGTKLLGYKRLSTMYLYKKN